MYLWAAVFSGIVVWLSIQRTVQPRGANHHGQPVLVFVAITAAAVVALLLIALPKLRWWGPRDLPGRAAATVPDGSAQVGPLPVDPLLVDPLQVGSVQVGSVQVDAVPGGAALAGAVPQTAGLAAVARTSTPTELLPPAAAPLAAPAFAEPQLVTAAAGSRTSLLAAPVPQASLHSHVRQNISHQVATPEQLEPTGNGSTVNGPTGNGSGQATSSWPESDWTQSRGWVDAAPDPGSARPASARPASARPASAQPASARPASAQPASAQPARNGPGPARSIIGTPPPALTSLDAASAAADDDADPKPGEATSGES